MINRVLITGLLLVTSVMQASGNESENLVEGAIDKVTTLHIALNGLKPSTDKTAAYETLGPIVKSTHDLDYIARFTLHRSWPDLNVDEQTEFTEQFEALSILLYIDRFGDSGAATFSTEAMTVDHIPSIRGDRAEVNTSLTTEKREISLSYSLHLTEEGWRIINIVADGVSDLALRRSEYAAFIQESGFDGLTEHIDQQIADLGTSN